MAVERPTLSRKRFLLFTKTDWKEAPRLRHQVAELLASYGHDVVFFQRPLQPGLRGTAIESAAERIQLVRTRQLLHHQLRATPLLATANAQYELRQIRGLASAWRGGPLAIINFNYDYYFLRDIFPSEPVLSVFNDDFVAGARISRREAKRVIRLTSMRSTHNLVVSYPLLDQIRGFTDRVSLFLPWARRAYATPSSDKERRDLLYWGYINDRIDYSSVEHVLSRGIRIHFVGPLDGSPRAKALVRRPNAEYHGIKPLGEMGAILSKCAASILPYNPADPMVSAITINNRAFDLLSCGLPLLYADLPGLIAAPAGVIYRCRTGDDYLHASHSAREQFWSLQAAIRAFLESHTGERRYAQLVGLVQGTS